MASDARLAKLHAHISACHTAQLPGARRFFHIGRRHVGYLAPAFAARLAAVSAAILITGKRVVLAAEAAGTLNQIAAAAGSRIRHEDFDVRETMDGPALAVLDRGALPDFGVLGAGVHVNGLVRQTNGWALWVAKRAAGKKLDPGKLDHLVAGGVPAGLTPWHTLLKEGAEEAAVPAALMAKAVPVARFTYNMERPEGLRRDVVFAYDLELPASFTPYPADGEVEYFELWPLPRVLETLQRGDDFKFNVTLVLIDLLIRHRLIAGAAAAGLRVALGGK